MSGPTHGFDRIDLTILRLLQQSGRMTNTALAEHVSISPPSTLERVRKLEAAGVITGYAALVDAAKVNQRVTAIVHVNLAVHTKDAIDKAKAAMAAFDEVQSCWYTAGDEDFVLRVLVPSLRAYERFHSEKLATVPNIARTKTAFVLDTVKHTTQIPLDAAAAK